MKFNDIELITSMKDLFLLTLGLQLFWLVPSVYNLFNEISYYFFEKRMFLMGLRKEVYPDQFKTPVRDFLKRKFFKK